MKIINPFNSTEICEQGKYVATIGFFDGVHCGHRFLLSRLREEAQRAGKQSLVITFDRHPRTVLDPDYRLPLLTTPQEKIDLLSRQHIDACAVLHFDLELAALSARQFIHLMAERLGVSILLVGYDHRFGHNRAEGFEDYIRYGKEVDMTIIREPSLEGSLSVATGMHVSSSEVRRQLADGNVTTAATLLGRPYCIAGTVVHGQGLGHKIGFATANVDASGQEKVMPEGGVYAVRVQIEGDKHLYHGMMNIGTRPTVSNENTVSLEVNIIEWEGGDLYDKKVKLLFDKRFRSEQSFPSLDQLAYQLKQDRQQTIDYYKRHAF